MYSNMSQRIPVSKMFIHKLDQVRRRLDCCTELERVFEASVTDEILSCPVKRAALAVLWASHNVRESGLSVATSIDEAAELQSRHQ